MDSPGVFHLDGDFRIYGGAPWARELIFGRWIDDGVLVEGDATLTSAVAVFTAEDVGAEIQGIDPDRPELYNELEDVFPKGTTIEAFIDEENVTLSSPALKSVVGYVIRIASSDITGKSYLGTIKEYAGGPALEAIECTPQAGGRLSLALTATQAAHLDAVIGSPRPASSRGTWDLLEYVAGEDDDPATDIVPKLTGGVTVERPVGAL